MSEFGGLWKHKNNQQALVPPKMECGCPCGGGIKKRSYTLPLLWRNAGKNTHKKHLGKQYLQSKCQVSYGCYCECDLYRSIQKWKGFLLCFQLFYHQNKLFFYRCWLQCFRSNAIYKTPFCLLLLNHWLCVSRGVCRKKMTDWLLWLTLASAAF